ncbi:uncharacterized protein LOC144110727 isoform X2 [Amblyomma americanum]
MRSQLKLQLSWLISEDEHSHDWRLAAYRAFFAKQAPLLGTDASFVLSEVFRKPVKSLYEEAIYQVDCSIQWPATMWFNLSYKYQQVGRAWCDAGRDGVGPEGKSLFQWLTPSLIGAFPLATHPVDRDVALLSVSFGTLVGLDTFVEHQIFSRRLVKDHRDYHLEATFQHDQRSLHIDLHLNHRSACSQKVAEYRFLVPYVNILKVLVNVKTRFVELFLHLKIPAMLMGEVVNEYHAKPGSAAAAAPLRWERYLTLGCSCIGGCIHGSSLCGGLILKLVIRDQSLAWRVVGRLSQRCTAGTLFCYAAVRTYCLNVTAICRTLKIQVHFENRVLRQFNAEFAIRVSFRDDNLDKLSFTLNLHSSRDDILEAVVARFMREGMRVGLREFKFLAPSTSQLRDHGTWMYAVDEKRNSAMTIRDWMGRFEGIHNVAKRMARMGQCFSSTEQAVRVLPNEVLDVPDIVGGAHPVSGKPYVFSDGVGMMSVPLAEEVYKVMKLKDRPSAIQIRYAGAKGMLCVNPELPDCKLLCLRPSMRKFPCTSSEYLEVIKISAPRSVTLNRPLITILEQLGVTTDTFLRLQQEMILEFTDALVQESTAIEVLSAWSKLPLPYQDLSSAGFQLTLDPFFRSLLLAVYRNAVAGLRYKTRIALPVDRARNMLGVVDTTEKLQYGQVFVQCTEMRCANIEYSTPPERKVITGTVLVTKCPCLHPGDVRKFIAVDVPELHHVVDCIVFPGQGRRPHPDEMAGSDLDGDEYIVIWEPCLFFPGNNQTPMTFSDRNPDPENKEITIEDMIQFLCNYIKNDSIGILSNAHLAWADQEREGIYSRRCLALAEKISVCLDFAKNGRTAFLRRDERPPLYPDFMEKGSHKITYRSDRALGVLYRTCRSLEAAVGRLGHRHVDPGRCHALVVPGWEEYRDSALRALNEYNASLRRILIQYGIASEGEVMACMVNTFDAYHSAQSDKLNMEDLVEKMTKFLTENTREVFFRELLEELEGHSIDDESERRARKHRKASAWYMVTYDPEGQDTLFSFPWCIADVLVEVLRSSDPQDRVWYPNILHWKVNLFAQNDDGLAEVDDVPGLVGETCKSAYCIIKKWLADETLLGQQEASALTKPGLCSDCLLTVFKEFLENHELSSLSSPKGKVMMRKRHRVLLPVAVAKAEQTALDNKCRGQEGPAAQPAGVSQVNGCIKESEDQPSESEPDLASTAQQNGHGDSDSYRHINGSESCAAYECLNAKEAPCVGTLVVSFLRWCLKQHKLPRKACPAGACAGGGYSGQTHRLPMVTLKAYSSLAVSLDPCHLSLPCDPAYHEPHQDIIERDPVRIQIANPAMHKKLKDNLDEVRQLLMRWSGVQDVQIQRQDESEDSYIVVTSTGRDWQIWFLEELLLQRWLPQAIDCRDVLRFLKENKQSVPLWGSKNLTSSSAARQTY